MKINGRLILFTLILVAITTICKYYLGPNLEWSGFSPVIAIALFAGMIFNQRNASFIMPLLAVFLSDVAIEILYRQGLFDYGGFYTGQWKNYLILLSATLIGWMLKGRSYGSVVIAGIIAPTVYFLLSNFAVWMGTTEAVYSKDFAGLVSCYTAALPFYKNQLIATLVFLPIIIILYNVMVKRVTALKVA